MERLGLGPALRTVEGKGNKDYKQPKETAQRSQQSGCTSSEEGCGLVGSPVVKMMVISAFVKLGQNKAKHAYPFRWSLGLNEDYHIFCSPEMCGKFVSTRRRLTAKTNTTAVWFSDVLRIVATALNSSTDTTMRRAKDSVVPVHCPSPELVLVWMVKPFLVQSAMSMYPARRLFAWVDLGFAEYENRHMVPPPAPWHRFLPSQHLAVARRSDACKPFHGRHTRCIVGTYMYGDIVAWQRFIPSYANAARYQLLQPDGPGLCADQDILEDAATNDTVSEFVTKDGWGWAL